jgi:uncharacterized nucleotidyltransferase DUF6036
MSDLPPEPWCSFFEDLNKELDEPVVLHCIGGFVFAHLYGTTRSTADIDYLALIPTYFQKRLTEIAGYGSRLHKSHKVYLEAVTVALHPDDYEQRLLPLFRGAWNHIELYALEAHDLALTKLERNLDRDRDDVRQLAKAGYLNPEVLRSRYQEEMRPYIASRVEWHDKTLDLWIESFWPDSDVT